MLQASVRLLKLLTLLRARSSWTGFELSERLEVTLRTLRRDVDRLRSLGYPVESTTGVAGGYRLGKGASLPPLTLDEDEATAVFIGLHTARDGGVTGADTAAVRALAKLEVVLSTRHKRKLAALQSSVLRLKDRRPAISLGDVSLLAMACADRLLTTMTYRAHGGATTTRTVEPLRIVRVGELFYLVAWDVAKKAWRTFRVDRIVSLAEDGSRFAARPPPGRDLVRFVTESLSTGPYRFRARVRLHAPAASLAATLTPFDGSLTAESPNRTLLETGAPSLNALAMILGNYGVDFEVLAPPELQAHLGLVAARLRRASKGRRARATPVAE